MALLPIIALIGADADTAVKLEKAFSGKVKTVSVSKKEAGLFNPSVWSLYEAVLTSDKSERVLKAWTGHPHLRVTDGSIEGFSSEIYSLIKGVEFEKKFVIEYPDFDKLKKYYPFKSDIEQVYLASDNGSHRIRRRSFGDTVVCFETRKLRISGSKCFENERIISEEEYNELLKIADSKKHPINKSRYCFVFNNHYFELDVYDFWKDKAILEIELRDEKDDYSIPPEIKVLADESDNPKFKNSYLASMNYEDYKTVVL